ncbi:unnamed protein product [Paramecium octaurelia]|uniref:Uncharacterized protein n=1 Tax=Paramecium octaurelia TaxID=43137 RepID=A0A8S1XJ72_PAROT|nr:unnamed protein product [Paramecium octaurelia]
MQSQLASPFKIINQRVCSNPLAIDTSGGPDNNIQQDLHFRGDQKFINIWKTIVKQEIAHQLHEEYAKQMSEISSDIIIFQKII